MTIEEVRVEAYKGLRHSRELFNQLMQIPKTTPNKHIELCCRAAPAIRA